MPINIINSSYIVNRHSGFETGRMLGASSGLGECSQWNASENKILLVQPGEPGNGCRLHQQQHHGMAAHGSRYRCFGPGVDFLTEYMVLPLVISLGFEPGSLRWKSWTLPAGPKGKEANASGAHLRYWSASRRDIHSIVPVMLWTMQPRFVGSPDLSVHSLSQHLQSLKPGRNPDSSTTITIQNASTQSLVGSPQERAFRRRSSHRSWSNTRTSKVVVEFEWDLKMDPVLKFAYK